MVLHTATVLHETSGSGRVEGVRAVQRGRGRARARVLPALVPAEGSQCVCHCAPAEGSLGFFARARTIPPPSHLARFDSSSRSFSSVWPVVLSFQRAALAAAVRLELAEPKVRVRGMGLSVTGRPAIRTSRP